MVRQGFLETAGTAVALLGHPAVAERWDRPSALAGMTVGALAGHTARQVLHVPRMLGQPPSGEAPISLIEHYTRSAWVGADPDTSDNTRIRRDAADTATPGAGPLAATAAGTVDELSATVPAAPADMVVHLPWGPWALTFDDFLTTRMLELVVHCDDLACSVDVPTPALPEAATTPVLDLLLRLAVRRHGDMPVLRALARRERAPATIAAL